MQCNSLSSGTRAGAQNRTKRTVSFCDLQGGLRCTQHPFTPLVLTSPNIAFFNSVFCNGSLSQPGLITYLHADFQKQWHNTPNVIFQKKQKENYFQ